MFFSQNSEMPQTNDLHWQKVHKFAEIPSSKKDISRLELVNNELKLLISLECWISEFQITGNEVWIKIKCFE